MKMFRYFGLVTIGAALLASPALAETVTETTTVLPKTTEQITQCRKMAWETYLNVKKAAQGVRKTTRDAAHTTWKSAQGTYKISFDTARVAHKTAYDACKGKSKGAGAPCRKVANDAFALVKKTALNTRMMAWDGFKKAENEALKAYFASVQSSWEKYVAAKTACAK